MVGYLIRRVAQAILVLFIVTVLTLALVHLFPGGPVRAILGPRATVAQVAYYNRLYGFDQPFYLQYVKWVGQFFHGNFGFSVKLNQSVAGLIGQDLPKTIVLVALGTIVSLLFGIPLGVYQAVKRYSLRRLRADRRLVPRLLDAHVLRRPRPRRLVRGRQPPVPAVRAAVDDLARGSLSAAGPRPAGVHLRVRLYALWSRYMRSSVLDNLVQDYVRTARAKGASERRVLWGHVFRNSLISIVTLLGLSLPTLVAGAIFIEVVFNYPGMGLAFYQAALNEDYEVLLGFTVLATIATIVGNLLADIGYAVLDPRVRYS